MALIVIKEGAAATGIVHGMVFDGPAPSWDEIRKIVYEGEDHPALVQHDVYKNRLTNHAVQSSAKYWVDKYVKTPSQIMLGTGAPPSGQDRPLATDTVLWQADPTTERRIDVKTVFLEIYSEFGYTYQTSEINEVQYTEAGLFDEDGVMWAHVILNLKKSAGQTGVVLWKVVHQGN